MPSSILNSDDGVISGTSGLKSTGGDDGVLVFQSKGTETARINTDKQIVAAAGTASLPIYSTTGDLNTGIFFPAADNIGFATNGVIRGRWTTDGLCFGSDTAAANALDDYEEGTWTATMTTTGTDFTTANRGTTGFYTKIGNLVTAFFDPFISTPSNGTGDFVITGLPFASVGNITYVSSMIAWGRVDLNGAFTAYGDVYQGTTMNFRYSQNNGLSVTLVAADLNGNSTPFMTGSITYRVA